MTGLSLYSGECDGLGLAAEMAGVDVLAYCEADVARRTRIAYDIPTIPASGKWSCGRPKTLTA